MLVKQIRLLYLEITLIVSSFAANYFQIKLTMFWLKWLLKVPTENFWQHCKNYNMSI